MVPSFISDLTLNHCLEKQKLLGMIDYVKLDISSGLNMVLNNELLSFHLPVNLETGEFKERKFAEYKNLLFYLKKNRYLTMEGSLHKFYNNGLHNHNDFDYSKLLTTIENLHFKFEFDPRTAILHNLEFGVNIEVPFVPKEFLKRQIINFKGQPKTKNSSVKGKGFMVEFVQTSYLIKFYDKGAMYKLKDNILRFEIRTKRMEFVRATGIETLADLTDITKLRKLKPILLKAYDDLLIYDIADEEKLSPEDLTTYLRGINPDYWSHLKPVRTLIEPFNRRRINPDYKKHQKKYYNEQIKFNDMLRRKNLLYTKQLLSKLIKQKCDLLIPD